MFIENSLIDVSLIFIIEVQSQKDSKKTNLVWISDDEGDDDGELHLFDTISADSGRRRFWP